MRATIDGFLCRAPGEFTLIFAALHASRCVLVTLERWESGRIQRTRNASYRKVPWVQIPPSPPYDVSTFRRSDVPNFRRFHATRTRRSVPRGQFLAVVSGSAGLRSVDLMPRPCVNALPVVSVGTSRARRVRGTMPVSSNRCGRPRPSPERSWQTCREWRLRRGSRLRCDTDPC